MSESGERIRRAAAAFVRGLQRLDRASRAKLKRAAGRTLGQRPADAVVFYKLMPEITGLSAQHLSDLEERFFVIATLYPLNSPEPEEFEEECEQKADWRANKRSMGALLGELVQREKEKGVPEEDARDRVGRRLAITLEAPENALPFRLRQLVLLLASGNVTMRPADWYQLLLDYIYWSASDRRVRWQWARDFYLPPGPERQAQESALASETSQ